MTKTERLINRIKEVPNFEVHGYDRYLYQFISKEFPDEVDYDFKSMKIMSLDIEVSCENGFHNVKECSEEMISINDLANMIIILSGKDIEVENVPGPEGVRGRNSDNRLIAERLGWAPSQPLKEGIIKTYNWIAEQVDTVEVKNYAQNS